MKYTTEDLKNFNPKFDYFIGIDSDGCVFDSMEPKQKECFCPVTIEKWGLAPISKYARDVWEFVNLYSQDRGCNRFLALLKLFDWLKMHPAVNRRKFEVPDLVDLRHWTKSETKLGNPTLQQEIDRTGSEELKKVMDWSVTINQAVARIVKGVGPFPLLPEILTHMREKADVIVVSSTPAEALIREWEEHDIDRFVSIIAGQEMGSKKEHLKYTTADKYQPEKVLMIGDAPGDMKAAKANNAMFYPIIPGREEESWERLYNEILDLFFSGKYSRDVETKLIDEFNSYLPASPAWLK
ncbi:HAD family hydrolase [candidate division KSB1 bacterium]|nr:HAD family hydrolase [candidate division KSB1 bacterium]